MKSLKVPLRSVYLNFPLSKVMVLEWAQSFWSDSNNFPDHSLLRPSHEPSIIQYLNLLYSSSSHLGLSIVLGVEMRKAWRGSTAAQAPQVGSSRAWVQTLGTETKGLLDCHRELHWQGVLWQLPKLHWQLVFDPDNLDGQPLQVIQSGSCLGSVCNPLPPIEFSIKCTVRSKQETISLGSQVEEKKWMLTIKLSFKTLLDVKQKCSAW